MSTTQAPIEQTRRTGFLESCRAPRLHLALIVALTGATGFYVAYLMLKSHMDAPWLRYPLAAGIAYLAFLLMLASWVRRRGEDAVTTDHGAFELGAFDGVLSEPPLAFDESADQQAAISYDNVDGYDAEALAFVVIASTALLGAIWAAVAIVWRTNFLIAELLLAMTFAFALYRCVRDMDGRYWLAVAMHRTLWRAIGVVLLLAVLGFALRWYAPDARAFGELWSTLLSAQH